MVNKLRSLAMATIALCLLSQSAWAEERIFVRQTQPQNQQQRTSDRVISITGVQLNPTETGLEIALQTAIGEAEQLQISNRTQENTYIAEIPNAQLQLPSGKPFRQENPIKGIREILIANSDRNTIRVSVLGETTAPQVELFDSDEGLIFALTPPLQREAQRSQIISVTGVQLNPTETGIELILQTPSGVAEQLQPNNLSSGNNFIVNIPNAQLQLPSRKPFRQENPTRGISEISATNFDANTIRVMAIGETALPQVELFDSNEGLIFGFTPPPPSLSPLQRGTQRSQEGQIVTIDRVQLNPTETGFEIVLLTPTGDAQNLRVVNISEGNNFIAEIPNAQINLPNTQPFRRENPIEGVSEVTVINQNENTVRVLVIGEDKQPTVELFDSEEGLIFSAQSEASESAQGEEDIELVVTGEQDGYRVPDTSTATRTDTPIRDIPQSIQVIPRQVLEDQKTTRLREALRNVSGVSEAFNFGGTTDSFIIRGFAQFNTLRDGFRIGQGGRETANLERIEVLKGPASVLYGNLEPGGVVNLVTKKPLSEPYYFAEFQAGNYDSYRGSLDFSGPIDPEKNALYRLNIAYENSDTFRQPVDRRTERFSIAPVLTAKIGNSTDLTFEFDYLNVEQPFDRGLVAIGDRPADIPITRFLGDPDDVYEVEEIGIGYRLEHRFNENITLRNAFRFQQSDSFDQKTQPGELDEETGNFSRRFDSNNDTERRYALQTDLISKFATGSIEHTLLFGFDLSRTETEGTNRGLPFAPDINIFNPIYEEVSRDLDDYTELGRDDFNRTDILGIFLQDQIAFTDNFKMLIGGRFDIVDQESEDRLEDTTSSQYDEAFTPRIGLVYQPIEEISLYASFSKSFAPNFATAEDGSFLDPERGTQYEIGIKADITERISATLAAYHITKTNIATTNPDNPDFSLPVGEITSQGIELDIAGEILPGWRIIASYSHNNSEITDTSDAESFPVGNKTENVAPNTASLWTTYEIQEGSLQGLGFGLGLFYADEKTGDFENTYKLPSFIRTDAAIFYRQNNWRAAVNFRNLFDVKYYESVNFGRGAIQPGAPFTVVGSFAIEF